MPRLLITIILILAFFHLHVGVNAESGVYERIFFAFSHVNIFHLLCNIIALWTIKGRLHILPAFIISFLSTYLPFLYVGYETTYGFSAVLFATVGIKWGIYFQSQFNIPIICLDVPLLERNIRRFFIYTVTPLIITMFIPNINWCIHIYALIMGLSYGAVYNFIVQRKK